MVSESGAFATRMDKARWEEVPVAERWSAKSVYEQVSTTASTYPRRPAVSFQITSGPTDKAITLTWAEVRAQAAQTANTLRELGVHEGDAVAYLLPNCNEAAITLIGGATAGRICPLNPLLDAVVGAAGDGQQLDPVTQFVGIGNVFGRNLADAFDMHAVEIDRTAVGQTGQNGKFVRRVHAVDVERRIGLGIAQFLRLGQHVGKAAAGLAHLRQDVIAGAVQDAIDPREAVARKSFPQRLYDRYAAGHGGLEIERDPAFLG